jgi:hypothetical protein
VEALRSDEYEQAKGSLRTTDVEGKHRYCCLGVACLLFTQLEPQFKSYYDEYSEFYISTEDGPEGESLPPTVQDWLGLRTDIGGIKTPDISLAQMNDSSVTPRTFKDIADVIESNPPGLLHGDTRESEVQSDTSGSESQVA